MKDSPRVSPQDPKLAVARLKALAFIRAAQGSGDDLPIEIFNPDRPDRTVFHSSYAALALSADPCEESLTIRRKLVAFIRSQREWPGLWGAWGKHHPMPRDLDDCSLGQIVLSMHGVPCWRTDWLFYLHRRRDGIFYAWMIPGNIATLNPFYWLLCLRDLTPARLHFRFFGLYGTNGAAHPRQFHLFSNTHIVHYLGDTPKSAPAIDWIIDTVITEKEFEREFFFRDPEILYLAIARAYSAGIARFGPLAEKVEQRIAERCFEDGRIGETTLSTAAACSALLHLGRCGEIVEAAMTWLLSNQAEDGGWPAARMDFAGAPPVQTHWGSRALTTALVVEALALFESWGRRSGPSRELR